MDERLWRPASHPGRRAALLAGKILRGQISDPTPEERLWLAVIEQAVREAYADLPADDERRAEARRWLDSEDFDEVSPYYTSESILQACVEIQQTHIQDYVSRDIGLQ